MVFISKSEKQTQKVAFEFAKKLLGGDIVLLTGYLGAGKTAFSKGIALSLGIDYEITSPTFTIMNDYKTEKDDIILCHIDAYRLSSYEEATESGLGEYIGESDTITLVEWHENIKEFFTNKKVYNVNIKTIDDTTREINIYDK